ncbi:MAG: LptA/OstA family protein [Opitutales bacterium]
MPCPKTFSLSLLCACVASAFAQMTPSAPVKDFRFPRFGENGYTQWVLQGARGIYDSEAQIRVEEMSLRTYTGDERMAKELSLDSPQATLRLQENRAFSSESIRIEGANFKVSGTGWEWIGETKEILVLEDTLVEFSQAFSGGLTEAGSDQPEKSTTIRSHQLVLQTTEKEYNFEFSGEVHVVSGDMDVKSHVLVVHADAPDGQKKDSAQMETSQLDSVTKLVASEDVVLVQGDRTVSAGEAVFMTRERRVMLQGTPRIDVPGAYLGGAIVRSRDGEIIIEGSDSEGRAQMILTETGGLGIQGASALSEETIVLADRITMRELEAAKQFTFEGNVEVMSGQVLLNAAKMTIRSDSSAPPAEAADAPDESEIKVGEVRHIIAEGGIRIVQDGQVATGERVTFYPSQERAVLSGSPRVSSEEAVISGFRMELRPKLAVVEGDGDMDVVVELPELPDLGYETYMPTTAASAKTKPESTVPPASTLIRSQLLRMSEEPGRSLFRFSDAVEVSATNLEATCERLDVIAVEKRSGSGSGLAEQLELDRIEAHKDVVIRQTGRTATARHAYILPKEGKVVLEDHAVVNDDRGRVSGYRITLLQGQRRAIVEGGGPKQERARITLPALPAMKSE